MTDLRDRGAPRVPGRKWYAIAAGVFLIGMALFALFLFLRLTDLGGELRQVVVPGETELVLEEPGTYTIFHEHKSVVGGRYYSSPEGISGLDVQIASSATGEPVQLRAPTGSTSYALGGRSGVSIFSFEVGKPGPYRLAAAYADGSEEPRVVLAVGHNFGTKLIMTVLGAIAIGLAAFVVAVAIATVTFWKRRKAQRDARSLEPGPAQQSPR